MTPSRAVIVATAAALSLDARTIDSLGSAAGSAATIQSLQLSDTSVTGGVPVSAQIVMTSLAASTGDTVTISSSPRGSVNHPAIVIVPKGSAQATFSLSTAPTASTYLVTIVASAGGTQKSASLRVRQPVVNSVTLSSASVRGGHDSLSATVRLDGIAPAGGVPVPLTITPAGIIARRISTSCSSSNITSCNPFGINPPEVAAGTTQVVVPLITSAVRSATPVTISAGNFGAQVQVRAPAPGDLSFSTHCANSVSTQIISGPRTLRVFAAVLAPIASDGAFLTLTSSSSAVAAPSFAEMTQTTTLSSVVGTLTPMRHYACVDAQVQAVSQNTPVTITASGGGATRTLTFTVVPLTLGAFSIAPELLRSGASTTGQITLSAPAAPGGSVVTLTSSKPAVASVPASITIPENQQNGSVAITVTVPAAHPDLATGVIITAAFAGRTAADTLIVRR